MVVVHILQTMVDALRDIPTKHSQPKWPNVWQWCLQHGINVALKAAKIPWCNANRAVTAEFLRHCGTFEWFRDFTCLVKGMHEVTRVPDMPNPRIKEARQNTKLDTLAGSQSTGLRDIKRTIQRGNVIFKSSVPPTNSGPTYVRSIPATSHGTKNKDAATHLGLLLALQLGVR